MMADLLKDKLNYDSLREFALAIKAVYPDFLVDEFLDSILDETWNNLELKARGRKITLSLGKYLPQDYRKAIAIIDKVIVSYSGWGIYSLPDFIEVFGQDEENWDISVAAMANYTQYASCELAVRVFIIKNEKKMMAQMYEWSKQENEHLRRLASEGCRPQLPWAIALTSFKQDPTPILPILEQLKNDPSLYVRKSVANNINDISKTHPDLVIELAKAWHGKNEGTDWIVKHGCRGLLKQGNKEALALFGYQDTSAFVVEKLSLNPKVLKIGESLTFYFTIKTMEAVKVRLEYGIDYKKASGKSNRKIFKISEIPLKKNEKRDYQRTHSFDDLSTRKHYPGIHKLTLIINGIAFGELEFELLPNTSG